MGKHFFIIAFRSLFKDKVITIINLTNLSVSFAVFILLTQFIYFQLQYDTFNKNYSRIYRVQLFMDESQNVEKNTWSVTAALSRQDLPKIDEVEKIALLHDADDNNKDGLFFSLDKRRQILVRYGYYTDPSIFDIFTFHFKEGSGKNAFARDNSILLSKSLASKLFPKGRATGHQIFIENKAKLTVTGVYDDMPHNSSFRPSFLIPMQLYARYSQNLDYSNDYWGYSFYTYVLLKKNVNPGVVDAKIKYALKNYRNEHYPYLRPLSKIHLNPYFQNDMYIVLSLFSFSALLILLWSSLNYANLQTANASLRMKEIGIKKTFGVSRILLLMQFILESVLMAVLAAALGFMLAQLFLPVFNNIIGFSLVHDVFKNYRLDIFIFSIAIVTGALSGIYPAVVISSFNPVRTLKERFITADFKGIKLKKVLIVVQFSISLFLLISSFIIFKQTKFMINRDLGFRSQNILYSNIITDKVVDFDTLRNRLLKYPFIQDACRSDYIPFILPGGDDCSWEGASLKDKVFVRIYRVGDYFFSTYGIKLLNGSLFPPHVNSDSKICIVNETAVRVFGWKQPVGKHIFLGKEKIEVIGVIKDFMPRFYSKVEPQMFRMYIRSSNWNAIYSVSFHQGCLNDAMAIVDKEFGAYFPNDVFKFKPMVTLLKNDQALAIWVTFNRIFLFFAIVAIMISSIGLVGLVLFYVKRRMKEICIRKVFGCSVLNIYLKLASEIFWVIMLSTLIAWPSGYIIYQKMPGFYKYNIQVWEFLLATAIIIVVAFLTISYHVFRVIRTNPVEYLRYE